jgi:hypothetical protein
MRGVTPDVIVTFRATKATDPPHAAAPPAKARMLFGLAPWENGVVLCPIALAVGCKKCPAFPVCPVKTVIGDYRPDEHPPRDAASKATRKRQK